MAFGSDLQQFVEAGWDWVQRDANTWVRAMGGLEPVLKEHDFESEDTLRFALRFSAFSIIIAMVVAYPAKQLLLGTQLSYSIYISIFILHYVIVFVYAISARLTGLVIFVHHKMRCYLILSLFATVYLPLIALVNYISFGNKELRQLIVTGLDMNNIGGDRSAFIQNYFLTSKQDVITFWIVFLAVAIYIFTRLVPACQYVLQIGRFKASLRVAGTAAIGARVQMTIMRPILESLLKTELGL
jgi:hypothetical protein